MFLGAVIAAGTPGFCPSWSCNAYSMHIIMEDEVGKMPVALSFYKVVPSNAAARSLIGAPAFSRAATWISCSSSSSCVCRPPASGAPFTDGDGASLEEGSALL